MLAVVLMFGAFNMYTTAMHADDVHVQYLDESNAAVPDHVYNPWLHGYDNEPLDGSVLEPEGGRASGMFSSDGERLLSDGTPLVWAEEGTTPVLDPVSIREHTLDHPVYRMAEPGELPPFDPVDESGVAPFGISPNVTI